MLSHNLHVDNTEKLVRLIPEASGISVQQYNPTNNTWQKLDKGCIWGDIDQKYYDGIRTVSMTIDGQQKLLAMILQGAGLEIHEYDPSKNIWTLLPMGPAWIAMTKTRIIFYLNIMKQFAQKLSQLMDNKNYWQ